MEAASALTEKLSRLNTVSEPKLRFPLGGANKKKRAKRYETLGDYAVPGVDVISVGALTHSAKAVDLSLTIVAAGGKKPGSKT